MTDLLRAVDNYLELRRSLGFQLEREGKVLPCFARYIRRSRGSHVTTAAAVAWSTQRTGSSYESGARRLAMVRIFCRYLQTVDPRTEVPPLGLLPYRTRRAVPYLYSDEDLLALMRATKSLRGRRWTPLTYSTLIGLLATTGMRLGEALGLDRADVLDVEGTVLARTGKPDKIREIPLHPSTQEALRKYARARDRRFPRPTNPSFFLSLRGNRPGRGTIERVFARLRRLAGLVDRSPRPPRLHDLRHTFAVRTLLDWHREGLNVDALLPRLSTYLGHKGPAMTYWYLSAAPELMSVAAERIEGVFGGVA